MRLFSRSPSNIPSVRRRTRLHFDLLENRLCPSNVGASLLGGVLQITQLTPGQTNLVIFGDKAAGAGNTATVFVQGGFSTTVNGGNQASFTLTFPGSLSAINVTLLSDNNAIVVGLPGQVLTLPSTALNVGFASGATGGATNAFVVGSPTVDVANTLNVITWAAPAGSTGQDVVGLFHATSPGLVVTQSNSPNDLVLLLGVAAPTVTTIAQGDGAGDIILGGSFTVPVVPVPSSLGITSMTQGNGNDVEVALNNTSTQSLGIFQGNGNSDDVGLGFVAGLTPAPAFNVSTAGTTIVQGTGSGDAILLGSLKDSVGTSIAQKDVSGNASGDKVWQFFFPSAVGGDARLQSLSVAQGSAAGDTVLLGQLADTSSHELGVTGTLSVTQNDLAGNNSDFIFIGSYLPPAPPTPPFTPNPTVIGFVVAGNVQTTQGNAFGDFLDVVYTFTTGSGMNFSQGNGGDDAIFQKDFAENSGSFVYVGGTGLNYVQADSVSGGGGSSISVLGNNQHSIFATDFKDFFGGSFSIPISNFGSVIFG
jgi:hypothetical protein